jgi:SAM-dependent methyltransferase
MNGFDAGSAFDEAFSGGETEMIAPGGHVRAFDVQQWTGAPDRVDRQLFIEPCRGPTLDVGCGPGRLAGDLTARGIFAMGIDVSREAVRQTRERGALALRRDVFSTMPGEGRWEHALLADGNLGIGGDPVRLLARLGELLAPGGTVIAEVADDGSGFVRERRRLRVDGRMSGEFEWAVVGLDAVAGVAADAGMAVVTTHSAGGRHAATLSRRV